MRKFQKATALALSSALALTAFAGCDKKDKDETTKDNGGGSTTAAATTTKADTPADTKATDAPAPEATTEEVKPTEAKKPGTQEKIDALKAQGIDLKGRDVRIVNWWEGAPAEPKNTYEEDLRDYREMIQDTFKFTIHTDNIGGWGESYTTQLSSSITAGEPIGQICVLDAGWVAGLMNNKMFAPLDTLASLDGFKAEKWNQGVLEAVTFAGHIYGMAVDHEPRGGIFFNKRLLQEAGYGADDLYDFQKDGKWTWTKFEEVLKACTRDKDGDGEIDTWGMVNFNSDYFSIAIYSSGAQFVSKDKDGHFVNEMTTQKFLDALTWANDMWQKYAEPQPADSDWDYFKQCFAKGEAAMRVTEEYAKSEFADQLTDEWGFVCFPCPDGQEILCYDKENVLFIPSSYSNDEANEIAFAYDLFTDPAPGYEDGEAWKEAYYGAYVDSRAVDETLNMMKRGKNIKNRMDSYVAGLSDTLGSGFIWDIAGGAVTPAEAVEAKKGAWDQVIADQNTALDALKAQ
ncbi:MAG: extracellular solute-binding protein [Lachnospiraceae bacterium]|nr:extracellular solute-binding protein [Lachnospiraceae bacterium]